MAVDCDASASGVQTSCQYGFGSTFMIEIHVTEAPANNYFGFQAKPTWNAGVLTYLPTGMPADEALWPSCGFPARSDNQPDDPSLLFGCVPGIGDPALTSGSDFVGAVLQFEFQCVDAASAPGGLSPPNGLSPPDGDNAAVTSPITLVPQAGDSQGGSHFLDSIGDRIDPALSGASVECSAAPSGPTPTATPGATQAPTGVGPTALPSTGLEAQDAGDGMTVRAWVIISLLLAAGMAGLALYGWRHIRGSRVG